jgi:hypothetical protein
MANPIKGIVAVISNYGIGKTTFALECGYQPKDIAFINDDVKSTGLESEFKTYINLVEATGKMKALDFHQYCLDLIEKLPKHGCIIWDTWTQFQATFPAYVKSNPNQFREPGQYSPKGSIKSGEQYQDAYRYEGMILSYLKTKCDLLIITFHLKQHYENNVAIPDKFRPGHDRAIEKYADLRIWLTPNPDSQVPIGLVLKNISKRQVTKSGIKTQQVLPLRIPKCNWESILAYWNEPIGDREPEANEKPSTFELSLIEGSLTPEDKRLYQASIGLVQGQQEAEGQEQTEAIKAYLTELNSLPIPIRVQKIKQAIEAGELEYSGEVTPGLVQELSG